MRSELCFQTSFLPTPPLRFQVALWNPHGPRVRLRLKGVAAFAAVRSRSQPQHTLYDLLELSPDVNILDIKNAYRQLARKYHPDVCPPHQAEESTRRFIEIQQAYETLSDPRLRAVYDHAVAMGRGSAVMGRMPSMGCNMENQSSDWKFQWESQLSELRRRSEWKARKADSWSARVKQQVEPHEA